MSELERYVTKRKAKDKAFLKGFDEGYDNFKLGLMLREAREKAGISQEALADKIHTRKSAISRLENHAEDIRLSTLEKVAVALGKKLIVSIQ